MEQFGGSPCEGEESEAGSCSEIACPQEGTLGSSFFLGIPLKLFCSCDIQKMAYQHRERMGNLNLRQTSELLPKCWSSAKLKRFNSRTVFGLTGELGEIAPSLVVAEIRALEDGDLGRSVRAKTNSHSHRSS